MTGQAWTTQWVEWPRLPSLLAGVSRWTMHARPQFEASAGYRWQDARGTLIVDVTSSGGELANGLQLKARVTPSSGTAQTEALEQVGLGLYQTNSHAVPGLRYTFTVSETAADGTLAPARLLSASAAPLAPTAHCCAHCARDARPTPPTGLGFTTRVAKFNQGRLRFRAASRLAVDCGSTRGVIA
jgi:hypothetical protein